MVVKYSNLFTAINPINHEPVTILVERIEAEGFQAVHIESLEGEYPSTEDFERERDARNGKIYTFLPLMPSDARRLVEALTEALPASEA